MKDIRTSLLELLTREPPPVSALKRLILDYTAQSADNAIDTALLHNLIEEFAKLSAKLKTLSETDHLTGIFNRVKIARDLESEVARAHRYGTPLSLIMFDLDHFKTVNDTYGHDIGDKVLKAVVNVVSALIRDSDVFARWGGEEFMVLLPLTACGAASFLAERLREAAAGYEVTGLPRFTGSFGVAQFGIGDSADTLIKRADEALYGAKKAGRNRVVCSAFPDLS